MGRIGTRTSYLAPSPRRRRVASVAFQQHGSRAVSASVKGARYRSPHKDFNTTERRQCEQPICAQLTPYEDIRLSSSSQAKSVSCLLSQRDHHHRDAIPADGRDRAATNIWTFSSRVLATLLPYLEGGRLPGWIETSRCAWAPPGVGARHHFWEVVLVVIALGIAVGNVLSQHTLRSQQHRRPRSELVRNTSTWGESGR